MRLCSSEAASPLRVSERLVPWLAAWVLLAIGCTQPSFKTEPEDSDESESSEPLDSGPTERDDDRAGDTGTEQPDSGSEPRDAGEQPAMSSRCDGGACSEVDAQTSSLMPEAGARDAGSEPGPGLDEVRAKWAGLYAARSALFGADGIFNGAIRVLSLIQIVPTPEGGLRLEEELCDYAADWQMGVSGSVNYRYAETRSSAALQYDGENFSSEQLTLRAGFGAAPASCSPGATVASQPYQKWLTDDTCDCPRSNDTPSSVRDCRLTDPEKDSQPGASFSASLPTGQYAFRVAQELRTSLVAGYRLGDRLYAERSFEERTNLLTCTINGEPAANSRCPVNPYSSCPARHNKVELVKVEAPTKCAQVVARESALFLSPLTGFPVACASELGPTPKP